MNFKRFQSNLIQLSTVDSTNNYAANLLKTTNVVNGTTILTKRQDFGRGQRGSSWQSTSELNLLASVIVFPNLKSNYVFYLNIAVSLAVEKTLTDLGIQSKVKWPNDIYVGHKKIAGILIENQLQGKRVQRSVIGLGLNVNQLKFPMDINGTSIALETGNTFEVLEVYEQFFGYLDFYIDHLMNSNFDLLLKRYYSLLYQYNELCSYEDENGFFDGRIQGIDADGKLLVRTLLGEKRAYDLKEIRYQV